MERKGDGIKKILVRNPRTRRPQGHVTAYNNPDSGRSQKMAVEPPRTDTLPPTKAPLALDERITRRMNFPFDQPIYKDLISLEVEPKTFTVVSSSRERLPPKDREPQLNDFIRKFSGQEYVYEPPIIMEERPDLRAINNLKLYKTLTVNNYID